VLFRDHLGKLGLIWPRCPHRAVDLQFGIPENEGLRCPYHGWMFDGTGQCIEQPLEPPDSTFKERGHHRVPGTGTGRADLGLAGTRPSGLQQQGVTRAQLIETIMHAQLSAGIRGLECCYRAPGHHPA
jgi:hypothetical protein